jgi:hypothetical protein
MFMYEDSEEEDIDLESDVADNIILIADIEWSPLIDYVPWNDPNFAQDIAARIKGITIESFAKEVDLWQQNISALPHYDELKIRQEVRSWDISIPGKDEFNFETHAMFYSLQVQYRNRLTEIVSVVNAHHEMLSQASKALSAMATKLASGTAVEKQGIGAFTVHPFTIAQTNSKRLLTYLEAVMKNIEFASFQMDRLLKEHQALSRINMNFHNEGMSALLNQDRSSLKSNFNNSTEIRSRNRRIN